MNRFVRSLFIAGTFVATCGVAVNAATQEEVVDYVRDNVLEGSFGGVNLWTTITPLPGVGSLELDAPHVARNPAIGIADEPFPYPLTWLVVIDDFPDANWAHATRWVFIGEDTLGNLFDHSVIAANWFPTIWGNGGAGPEVELGCVPETPVECPSESPSMPLAIPGVEELLQEGVGEDCLNAVLISGGWTRGTCAVTQCVGGANNGNACTGAANCPGGACRYRGTCSGGANNGNACAGAAGCPGGRCLIRRTCVGGANIGNACSNDAHCPLSTCGNPCDSNVDCQGTTALTCRGSSNHDRYKTNLVSMYQKLTACGFPAENIYVYYSDGAGLGAGLDLDNADGDNNPRTGGSEVNGPATEANVRTSAAANRKGVATLCDSLDPDRDVLFVYTTNHGTTTICNNGLNTGGSCNVNADCPADPGTCTAGRCVGGRRPGSPCANNAQCASPAGACVGRQGVTLWDFDGDGAWDDNEFYEVDEFSADTADCKVCRLFVLMDQCHSGQFQGVATDGNHANMAFYAAAAQSESSFGREYMAQWETNDPGITTMNDMHADVVANGGLRSTAQTAEGTAGNGDVSPCLCWHPVWDFVSSVVTVDWGPGIWTRDGQEIGRTFADGVVTGGSEPTHTSDHTGLPDWPNDWHWHAHFLWNTFDVSVWVWFENFPLAEGLGVEIYSSSAFPEYELVIDVGNDTYTLNDGQGGLPFHTSSWSGYPGNLPDGFEPTGNRRGTPDARPPIPTISEWGLVAMILLLFAAGAVVLRWRATGTRT